MKTDVFPTTQYTWMDDLLVRGERAALAEYILRVYAAPLRIYLLGLLRDSFADLRERGADDLLQGFLVDRLERPGFLPGWRASGLRLRRWLMNALCFYLRELRRAEARNPRRDGALADDLPAIDQDLGHEMDREFLRAVVQEALGETEAACSRKGLAEHFGFFQRHHLGGTPQVALAREASLSPERVGVMIRTAERWFVACLRAVVERDGAAPERVEEEIAALVVVAGAAMKRSREKAR